MTCSKPGRVGHHQGSTKSFTTPPKRSRPTTARRSQWDGATATTTSSPPYFNKHSALHFNHNNGLTVARRGNTPADNTKNHRHSSTDGIVSTAGCITTIPSCQHAGPAEPPRKFQSRTSQHQRKAGSAQSAASFTTTSGFTIAEFVMQLAPKPPNRHPKRNHLHPMGLQLLHPQSYQECHRPQLLSPPQLLFPPRLQLSTRRMAPSWKLSNTQP